MQFEGSALKRLLAIVMALLGVAAALYWFGGERSAPVDAGAVTGQAPAPGERSRVEPGPAASAEPHAEVARGRPLWQAVDEGSLATLPFFAEQWSTAGRVLVRVSGASAAAQGWQVGDRLSIPLPHSGETYGLVIDEIDNGPGRSRAVLGKALDAEGFSHRIVVTVGPQSMFAFIDTPEGPYELVAGSDYGWLLPTASMMAGFDYSEPDYILPEHGLPPQPQ